MIIMLSLLDNNTTIKNSNLQDDFNGISCFEWRQGVKHDCSKVMELTNTKNGYVNKQKTK